jgi:serine/threonine protein kinase
VHVVADAEDSSRPTLPRLEHGSVFAGYWIDRLLDRGGMGVVYKAMDIDLDRAVALKLIAPEYTEDETAAVRFRTESRLAASLEHPNIVPVHRGGEENGVLYLAMRFVPGTNLRRLVNRGPLPLEVTSDIVTQIAGALDAAHARGMVHRDVKPANILISDETTHTHAYLTDFGLTKRPGSTGNLTGTGLWVGTADYVAPEQIQGATIDGRADIYSLGCVLHEMLTGQVPYPKDGDIAKLWAHISTPPPQPTVARPDLVPAFDDIVARATAKDPADRYATAGDLAAAAREAIALQRQAQRGAAFPATAVSPRAPLTPAPPAVAAESGPPATPSQPPSAPSQPPPTPSRPPAPGAPPWPAAPPLTPASAPTAAPSWPAATPAITASAPSAAASTPAATPPQPTAPPSRRTIGRGRTAAIALVTVVACAVATVVLLSSGGKDKRAGAAAARTNSTEPAGDKLSSSLGPVPTNRVHGAGDVSMRLNGTVLTVTATTRGLLDNKHAMHIHAGARGVCPSASAAHRHNGHMSVSTLDGVPFYGPPVTALTTTGDTSPKSILAFNRFPSGSDIRYARQIKLSDVVAANIRNDDAVVVVHGIDYDHDGTYGNVLDRSDLDRSLPGEITAPALCGQIVAAQPSTARPTKTARAPAAPKDTLYTASLQSVPDAPRQPESPNLALLCHLGDQGEGDRTPTWDA